jgi:hypothetical protein
MRCDRLTQHGHGCGQGLARMVRSHPRLHPDPDQTGAAARYGPDFGTLDIVSGLLAQRGPKVRHQPGAGLARCGQGASRQVDRDHVCGHDLQRNDAGEPLRTHLTQVSRQWHCMQGGTPDGRLARLDGRLSGRLVELLRGPCQRERVAQLVLA